MRYLKSLNTTDNRTSIGSFEDSSKGLSFVLSASASSNIGLSLSIIIINLLLIIGPGWLPS